MAVQTATPLSETLAMKVAFLRVDKRQSKGDREEHLRRFGRTILSCLHTRTLEFMVTPVHQIAWCSGTWTMNVSPKMCHCDDTSTDVAYFKQPMPPWDHRCNEEDKWAQQELVKGFLCEQ